MGANPAVPMQVHMFFLIIFLFIFYMLILRPQQKKQKEHQSMLTTIKKNDEVVTMGGIHGTVVNVKEKTFVVRIDDNTKIEIDKGSIAYMKRKRDDKTS